MDAGNHRIFDDETLELKKICRKEIIIGSRSRIEEDSVIVEFVGDDQNSEKRIVEVQDHKNENTGRILSQQGDKRNGTIVTRGGKFAANFKSDPLWNYDNNNNRMRESGRIPKNSGRSWKRSFANGRDGGFVQPIRKKRFAWAKMPVAESVKSPAVATPTTKTNSISLPAVILPSSVVKILPYE